MLAESAVRNAERSSQTTVHSRSRKGSHDNWAPSCLARYDSKELAPFGGIIRPVANDAQATGGPVTCCRSGDAIKGRYSSGVGHPAIVCLGAAEYVSLAA